MKLIKKVFLLVFFALNLNAAEEHITLEDLKENVQLSLYCLDKYNFLLKNPYQSFDRSIFESVDFNNCRLYGLPYDGDLFCTRDCDEIDETQDINVIKKNLIDLNEEWEKIYWIVRKKLTDRYLDSKDSSLELKFFFLILNKRRPLYNVFFLKKAQLIQTKAQFEHRQARNRSE